MRVRKTVDIPEELHDKLRRAAEIGAIEQVYRDRKNGAYVTGALVKAAGELGPACPIDENPHALAFS